MESPILCASNVYRKGVSTTDQDASLQIECSNLTIVPGRGNKGSHTQEAIQFPWTEEETPEQQQAFENAALHVCVGYAALRAAGYDESESAEGCGSDFDAVGCSTERALEEVKRNAVDYMSYPKNVLAVHRVTDELMKRLTLDGEHVEVLVELADGAITEDEYQQYLALTNL